MSALTRFIAAIFLTSLSGAGIYDYVKLHESNACEMTWMYEYPIYQKIKLSKEVTKAYPKYSLYLYGEGVYAESNKNLKLRGVPVLFIPGNAGSYRQVRSLGSVSLRKSENINNKIVFNYFSIDFNEELSGFSSGLLHEQTEFTSKCIDKILGLYKSARTPPSSVILAGHSMGGIIARAVFTLPEFNSTLVNTIITQATPHQSPVVPLEKGLVDFYRNVNDYWKENAYTTLDHVTVVSTGGGYRDILVRNGLTSLDNIVRPDRHIGTCTMSVPKAFVSSDHLCAVWCRQIVLVTTRSLFDIIDSNAKQVMENAQERIKIFRHHFISNPGVPYSSLKTRQITLDNSIPWEEKSETLWRFVEPKMKSTKYFAIPLVEEEENSLIVIGNVTNTDWICTCSIAKGEQRCKTCNSLSDKVRLLPGNHRNKRVLQTKFEDLDEKATHVVIIVKPSKHRVDITVELYNSITRHLLYTLPGFYDNIISYPVAVIDASAMLQIPNRTVFYSLHLSGMDSPLKAYTAELLPRKCQKIQSEDEGTVFSLNIPWSNESVYTYSSYGEKGVLDVKLQSGRPINFNGGAVHLEMYLHPNCFYQLRLKLSTINTLGQIIRYYAGLFPAVFVAIIFLSISYLLRQEEDNEAIKPQDIIWNSSKPYIIIPIVSIIKYILSVPNIEDILLETGLPIDDSHSLQQKAIWSPFLPSILFMLSFGFIYLYAAIIYYLFSVIAVTVSKIFSWVPNIVFTIGYYLQFVVGITSILISILYCGIAGLVFIFILIIIHVLQLYYLSSLTKKTEDQKRFNFSFIILLLYLWNILLNLPFMVIWIKNLSFGWKLLPDPSCVSCSVLSVCGLLFIVLKPLTSKRSSDDIYGWMYILAAVIMMLYCLESIYRIPFVSATMICVLTLHQLYSNFTQR